MRRSICCVLLCAGWFLVVPAPAAACLWDREMVPHEKQFKSSYLESPSGSAADAFTPPPQWIWLLGGGAGVLMLTSGLVIAVVRGRAAQRDLRQSQRLSED